MSENRSLRGVRPTTRSIADAHQEFRDRMRQSQQDRQRAIDRAREEEERRRAEPIRTGHQESRYPESFWGPPSYQILQAQEQPLNHDTWWDTVVGTSATDGMGATMTVDRIDERQRSLRDKYDELSEMMKKQAPEPQPEVKEVMILSTIKRGGYRVFADQDSNDKQRNMSTIAYIEFLANRVNVKIDEWDLYEHFGDISRPGQRHFISDKTKINSIFFGIAEKEIEKKEAKHKVVSNRTLRKTEAEIAKKVFEDLQGLKGVQPYFVSRIAKLKMQMDEVLLQAARNRHKIEALEKVNIAEKVTEQIKLISSERRFSFEGYNKTGQSILFKFLNDVVVSRVNQAAGLNQHVNFGKMKISIDLFKDKIRVIRARGGLMVHDHMHPHVGSIGDPCLGNAAPGITRAMNERNYHRVLELMTALLLSYNADNPYVKLNEFYVAQEDRKGRSPDSDSTAFDINDDDEEYSPDEYPNFEPDDDEEQESDF
jgi:hypothetical protein